MDNELNLILQGPESFYEGQLKVTHILETQHYPSFLVSDVYNRYMRSLEDGTQDLKSDSSKGFNVIIFELSVISYNEVNRNAFGVFITTVGLR